MAERLGVYQIYKIAYFSGLILFLSYTVYQFVDSVRHYAAIYRQIPHEMRGRINKKAGFVLKKSLRANLGWIILDSILLLILVFLNGLIFRA